MSTLANPYAAPAGTGTDNDLCHVVCGKFENRTLCGLVEDGDDWCNHGDDCRNVCVVCRDLHDYVAAEGVCEVCGTCCWEDDQ